MIPIYQPDLTGKEKEFVVECMDSTWISSKGKFVRQFEEAFAEYIGVKYATSVSNGTVAIHLALLAIDAGPGDEVIVPSFTYVASVNPIVYQGATPVFVDSLEDTWQMDEEEVERKITSNTKAIIAPHIYGHPCKLDKLREMCDKYQIYLIEDCAEAIGSEYAHKKVGSYGDLACFSFFGNKTITTGEGGMLLSDNKELLERARHIKDQGMSKTREYWHDVIGYNYRMTNLCAAIGCAQLEKVEQFKKRKIEIGNIYQKLLGDAPVILHRSVGNVLHTYWMVSLLLKEDGKRESLRKYLKEHGIDTRPTFYPVHKMPMYDTNEVLKTAEMFGERGINLPSYPKLQDREIEFICSTIIDYFQRGEDGKSII